MRLTEYIMYNNTTILYINEFVVLRQTRILVRLNLTIISTVYLNKERL